MRRMFLLALGALACASDLKAEVVNWHGFWVSSEDLAKFSSEELARADRSLAAGKILQVDPIPPDPTPTPSAPKQAQSTAARSWGSSVISFVVSLFVICCTLLGIIFGLIFYFLPAFIGSWRRVTNGGAIAVINLFFGWTFLGWLAALIWACTDKIKPEVVALPASA